MGSEYEFFQLKNKKNNFTLEVPNCTITGNSVKYELKDNSILAYNLDSEGKVVSDLGESKKAVELAKYQLSIFEILKGRDGNENDFDKDDLKGLTEEELIKLINDKFASGGVYTVKEVKLKNNSISIMLYENGKEVRKFKIKFDGLWKKTLNFFKSLYNAKEADRPKGTVEVGKLEVLEVNVPEEEDSNLEKINESIKVNDSSNNKISILGFSGMEFNDEMLGEKKINRNNFTDNEAKIFDLYNTNYEGKNKKILDEVELKNFLFDLLEIDKKDFANKKGQDKHKKDNSRYLLPVEILAYLKQKGLDKDVDVQTLISFIQKIVNYCTVEDLTEKSNLKPEILSSIDEDNMLTIISDYKEKEGDSLIKGLYDSDADTRCNSLLIVGNKLIAFAEKCGVNYSDFKTKFEASVSKLATEKNKKNRKALEALVNDFVDKLKEKEPLYKANKNGIINMLSDSSLCYSREDLSKVIDNIMKYSNKYNPKDRLGEMVIENKKAKDVIDSLLDSNYLDYYPIFAAAIISHETQFLEQGDDIFDEHGRGVMQITEKIAEDMYKTPNDFNEDFVKKIKLKYADSKTFYEAVKDQRNIDLHYEAGMVALEKKIIEATKFVRDDKYKILKIETSGHLLELGAMHYNSNSASKKDSLYVGTKNPSQVRYIYARDVIQRFNRFTPEDINASYYEWNPVDKQWVYKTPKP